MGSSSVLSTYMHMTVEHGGAAVAARTLKLVLLVKLRTQRTSGALRAAAWPALRACDCARRRPAAAARPGGRSNALASQGKVESSWPCRCERLGSQRNASKAARAGPVVV